MDAHPALTGTQTPPDRAHPHRGREVQTCAKALMENDMSTGSPTPEHIRQAAVADYLATRESYAVVAARHGVARGALHSWVNGSRKRKQKSWRADEFAYVGGWEVRGGIRYPLLPERRSA